MEKKKDLRKRIALLKTLHKSTILPRFPAR